MSIKKSPEYRRLIILFLFLKAPRILGVIGSFQAQLYKTTLVYHRLSLSLSQSIFWFCQKLPKATNRLWLFVINCLWYIKQLYIELPWKPPNIDSQYLVILIYQIWEAQIEETNPSYPVLHYLQYSLFLFFCKFLFYIIYFYSIIYLLFIVLYFIPYFLI